MIEDDPFLRLQAHLSAQEFVLKALLIAVNQLAPNAGLYPALRQIVDSSINAADVEAVTPELQRELREYVKKHAAQIIEAASNARLTK